MPNTQPSTLTTFLATYGALLSSATLGWTLLRDLNDRARLQVRARVGRMTKGSDGQYFIVAPHVQVEVVSDQLYVFLTVVNVGRRQTQWEGWGGKYRKRVNGKEGFFIVGRDLPRMLKERESHTEWTPVTDELMPAAENVKKIYMWDTSGKEWKLSWWQLRKLRAEIRKFVGKDSDQT
jgi:hypothetical protein